MQDNFDKRLQALEEKLAKHDKAIATAPKGPLISGFGPIQFDGLIQGRFDTDSHGNDTFYLRRTELKLSGKIGPRTDWVVMVDPAKNLSLTQTKVAGNVTNVTVNQSSRILQDAFLAYHFTPNLTLDVGQEKIPFGYEALQPTSQLDVIERALFMSQAKWADVRDIGLQAKGSWNDFAATAAVLNGEGEEQNQKDSNPHKAVGGRVTYAPHTVPGLQAGISGITESDSANKDRNRIGADVNFKRDKLTLRTEYAAALTSGTRAYGWYAHAGYRFLPQWEGIVRFDTLNPNRASAANREEDWIGGVNYFINSNTEFQLNYLHKRFFNGTAINNQLLANFQVRW